MELTVLPAQALPDPGALLVWVPAVALLFLLAVAYVEHRSHRELVTAGELDPEFVQGRAWSMLLAAGLLLATFALGLVAVMLVVGAVPFDALAERTAWIVGPLLSLGIALAFVWWLGRPFEPAPVPEPTEEDGTEASRSGGTGGSDAPRDSDAGPATRTE